MRTSTEAGSCAKTLFMLLLEALRCCGDINTLLFAIDDTLDYESDEVVKQNVKIILNAMKYPHIPRPAGEWIVGEMIRQ